MVCGAARYHAYLAMGARSAAAKESDNTARGLGIEFLLIDTTLRGVHEAGRYLMRRLPLLFALVAVLVVAAALPAGADPQAETFVLTCDSGIPSGTITANSGRGLWTPGFASASTGVYIPYGFEFNATFTPDEGDPIVLPTDVFMKKAPENTKSHLHGVCTFGGEERLVDDPDFGTGVIRFEGTAYVFWTGK
jgi:hypothetical protein